MKKLALKFISMTAIACLVCGSVETTAYAQAAGNQTIEAQAELQVERYKDGAEAIKLNTTKKTIYKGKTLTLKATLKPAGVSDKITWTSSKPKIASVSNKGKVTGLKKGTTTITAKTASGKKATCKVTVKEVAAKKIKLNKSAVVLEEEKIYTLKPTLTPKNSTDTLKWSSSNPKVATVSSKGKITAIKPGTATITVKTQKGKKATCKVTVKETWSIWLLSSNQR